MTKKYVALDVHKASIVIGVRDEEGDLISEAVVQTKAETELVWAGLSSDGRAR